MSSQEICEFPFDTLEEVQNVVDFNDFIEFEEDGEEQLGFYIGNGYVFVLEKVEESTSFIESDGFRKEKHYSKETVDVRKVNEFKDESDYKKHKYKVIRKQIPWSTLSTGGENEDVTDRNETPQNEGQMEKNEDKVIIEVPEVKEHDVVEVEHPHGIKHFALCTQNGKAIDLNPETTMQALGKPIFTSCIRGDREDDNYGINRDEPMRFANGLIQERPLAKIIKQRKYRIRDDFLTVEVVRNGERTVYRMKPLPDNEIRANVEKAREIKLTRYNICRLNCEHFVMFLKYGACVCSQTQKVKSLFKRLFIPFGDDMKDSNILNTHLTAD